MKLWATCPSLSMTRRHLQSYDMTSHHIQRQGGVSFHRRRFWPSGSVTAVLSSYKAGRWISRSAGSASDLRSRLCSLHTGVRIRFAETASSDDFGRTPGLKDTADGKSRLDPRNGSYICSARRVLWAETTAPLETVYSAQGNKCSPNRSAKRHRRSRGACHDIPALNAGDLHRSQFRCVFINIEFISATASSRECLRRF